MPPNELQRWERQGGVHNIEMYARTSDANSAVNCAPCSPSFRLCASFLDAMAPLYCVPLVRPPISERQVQASRRAGHTAKLSFAF